MIYVMTPKTYLASSQRGKNDSGELDVFEAAGYYSGQNDLCLGIDDVPQPPARTRRMSLDDHTNRSSSSLYLTQGRLGRPSSNNNDDENKNKRETRQPRSPGGKLASFLNSLFNQSKSRKKMLNKSNSGSADGSLPHSLGKEYEDPEERRRRRSSISHYRSSSTNTAPGSYPNKPRMMASNGNNDNLLHSVTTPTKSYKDLKSLSDQGMVGSSRKPIASVRDNRMMRGECRSWLKSSGNTGMEFHGKFNDKSVTNRVRSEECLVVVDEGAESDSSSDLFELEIGSAGGYCSSGLPVYETTRIERIKISDPINARS